MYGFIKNIFLNGINAFIKFSKYSYSKMYFNNYCFVFFNFLQSALVFILFTINAWNVINKMFLNIITSIKQIIININGKGKTNKH